MRVFSKLIWVLICCFGYSSFAATINVPCNYPSILTALTSTAQEGDTVLIGAGDCIISNQITIARGISFTIAGSGTNLTTLRSAAGLRQMIWVTSSSMNTFTIRDLNIVGASPNDGGTIVIGNNSYIGQFKGPFHIYNIRMTNVIGRGFTVGYGNSYGLIDHVYAKAMPGYQQMISFEGGMESSWTNPNPLGTTKASYVEDCVFVTRTTDFSDPNAAAGNGFFDSYDGAQLVFRHNYCDGYSPIGGHGYDSSSVSVRTWEVYNNIFTNWTGNFLFAVWRGGTGVMFSNQVYGTALSTFTALDYYRSNPDGHPYGIDRFGHTSYIVEGVPGKPYIINFNGIYSPAGQGVSGNGNPSDGGEFNAGFSRYHYSTNLATHPYYSTDIGGGVIRVGTNVAETIRNTYAAINLAPGGGVNYTNRWGRFLIGHEFIATGYDTTNLYLINALDGTNAFGYPANNAIGTLTSYPLTGTNFVNQITVWPAYSWSNTVNGVIMGFTEPTGYSTNIVKLGRDFFNDVIPAANVYRPLVYPHPLNIVAGGGVGAPQPVSPNNLRPGSSLGQ